MTATRKGAILVLIICTANLIFSAELETSPHDVVYACMGKYANLLWKRSNNSGHDTGKIVSWFFHSASTKHLVGTFLLGQFFAAQKYVDRASQFEQYGVTLIDVTTDDAGSYSVEYVATESNASFPTPVYQNHSMFLQVSDGPMVKRGRLEVTQDLVPLWNTTAQQWTIRLLCGFFTFQGEPPIQVEWIVPGGEVEPSSGYTGDHFYLSLFSPFVNVGNYTCRIPHQFHRDACFEPKTRGDTISFTEATTVLDELRVQLVLANAEIKQLRQEKERLQDNVNQHADEMKQQVNQLGVALRKEISSSIGDMEHQLKTLREEYNRSKEDSKNELEQIQKTLREEYISATTACSKMNYTVLSEDWRATSSPLNHSDPHCDYTLPEGWYRFMLNGGDAVMPTSCVQSHHCSTHASLWLDLQGQSLPGVGQQVQGQACASWDDGCCSPTWVKPRTTVRNCGTFNIYNLQRAAGCNLAYCTTSL